MKKIINFMVLFLLISCDNSSDSQISKMIDKECVSNDCEIVMSNIITEDWDFMYIFKTTISLDEINNRLGFEYPYFEDIANRVIFVKNNKIIYHEDEFPNSEKTKKGELIFNIGDVGFLKIPKEKAIFKVSKEDSYFKLKIKN